MKKSAGVLLHRIRNKKTEVLLVHPGGPFWAKKDEGAWSLPKGEFVDAEDPLEAAKREFFEETGLKAEGNFLELNPIRQRSGKMVYAWAVEQDLDVSDIKSNTCRIEWPPRSGRQIDIPEVDRAEWFDIDTALQKIMPHQDGFIQQLLDILDHK